MKRYFLLYFVCGIAFWIPSVIIHAIRSSNFGSTRFDILAISLLAVIASIATLEIVDRKRIGNYGRGMIALWMLFGIWFTGPLMMMITFTFSGSVFARSDAWRFASSA